MKSFRGIRSLLFVAGLTLVSCATPSRPPVVHRPPVERPRPTPQPVPRERTVPAEEGLPFRTIVAVQTCLDRNNFSCGSIDGELHEQTTAALKAWQQARGLPESGVMDDATLRRVGNLDAEFTTYTVTAEDVAALTEFPTSWLEKAKMTRLGYATVLEAVAEKFHISEDALQRLNPDLPWPDPPAGSTVVVPKCLPGKYVAVVRLTISLSRKELEGFDEEGKRVVHFPCSIARDVSKRPVGELKVINAASDPVYTFDPALFSDEPEAQTISNRLLIPAGPNNPVGLAWIGLDKPGYGIHGTAWPADIGKTESHGCFRLQNWNAQKLIKMVKLGAPVLVSE